MSSKFVMCIDNKGYKFSLTVHKVYQLLPDSEAEADGMIRIVDDTGEDYLFGEQRFVPVDLPPAAQESFTKVAA
ncbi:MAG: hypothetical protein IT328_03480 [Caldilineaceae bacterium]|nr:hypothetical protein [Caldilineaceae bacterium]